MKLKKAAVRNIPRIMELIDQAKEFLRQSGVDHWQGPYPDLARIEKDVAGGKGLLCVQQGVTVGDLCRDFEGDPAYEALQGLWLSDRPYAVVHRLAIDNSYKGQGLATLAFTLAEERCRAAGIYSLRVDTDGVNRIMQHILQKSGYQYCGTICFDNSEKIAFEKLL